VYAVAPFPTIFFPSGCVSSYPRRETLKKRFPLKDKCYNITKGGMGIKIQGGPSTLSGCRCKCWGLSLRVQVAKKIAEVAKIIAVGNFELTHTHTLVHSYKHTHTHTQTLTYRVRLR